MNGKLLVIVDMQNDFLTGTLANPDGVKVVPKIVDLIKKWEDRIIVTQDTHYSEYLNTLEGKCLPVKHCIYQHAGWCLHDDIIDAIDEKRLEDIEFVEKNTFGALDIKDRILNHFGSGEPSEIVICGVCTDICVISNAIILRASYPNTPITCKIDCCAASGATPELRRSNQNAAISIMTSCQIVVSQEVKVVEKK
jgi:nicotinamidase-related amidase